MTHPLRLLLSVSISTPMVSGACGSNAPACLYNPGGFTLVKHTSAASGDGQIGSVGSRLPLPLRAQVSVSGCLQSGVMVSWTTSDSGGIIRPASAFTDGNGIVVAAWTLGARPGTQTVTVDIASPEYRTGAAPDTFRATANK